MFRSVRSIVIAPASTGREASSRTAVIRTAHTNKNGVIFLSFAFAFIKVPMKFIAPKIELTPAK